MTGNQFSRRGFLAATAAAGAAATVTTSAGAARASTGAPVRPMALSTSNGWPVLRRAESYTIEGTGQRVALAAGDAAVVLLHVARRFNYEIDQLRAGDVHGFSPQAPGRETYESYHRSGSAIAIRPEAYPAGVEGGLYPSELVVVRDILAELDGVVVWGGDLQRPKESHFHVAYRPGHVKLRTVARRISGWVDGPGGQGAGATDAFDPARLAAARAFARRTR